MAPATDLGNWGAVMDMQVQHLGARPHSNGRQRPATAQPRLQGQRDAQDVTYSSFLQPGYGLSYVLNPSSPPTARQRQRPRTANPGASPCRSNTRALGPQQQCHGSSPDLLAGLSPTAGPRGTSQAWAPPKPAEALYSELLQLKQQFTEAQQQLTAAQAAQRRAEAEAARLRTNLLRAEDMLGARESALSPNMCVSSLYRSPDTTSLVGSLKQALQASERARQELQRQLDVHAKSVKATAVSELQSELLACQQELQRQMAISAELAARLSATQADVETAHDHLRAADEHIAELQRPGRRMPEAPPELPAGNTLSRGRASTTLEVLAKADIALISQAALLQSATPLASDARRSMKAFERWAACSASTAGAPAVLRSLRATQARLAHELGGLPGDAGAATAAAAVVQTATMQAQVQGPQPPQQGLDPAGAGQPQRPRPRQPGQAGPAAIGAGGQPAALLAAANEALAAVAAVRAQALAQQQAAAAAPMQPASHGGSSSSTPMLAGLQRFVLRLKAADSEELAQGGELGGEVRRLGLLLGAVQQELARLTGATGEDEQADSQALAALFTVQQ